MFKKTDNKEFRLVKYLTIGEAEFSQIMRLRNRWSLQQKTLLQKKTPVTPAVIPILSKDMDEQLKLAHKVVDVKNCRLNRKISVTLLRYSVDKP